MFPDLSVMGSSKTAEAYFYFFDPQRVESAATTRQFPAVFVESQWPTLTKRFQKNVIYMLPAYYGIGPGERCLSAASPEGVAASDRQYLVSRMTMQPSGKWDRATSLALAYLMCTAGEATHFDVRSIMSWVNGQSVTMTERMVRYILATLLAPQSVLTQQAAASPKFQDYVKSIYFGTNNVAMPKFVLDPPAEDPRDEGWFNKLPSGERKYDPPSLGGGESKFQPWFGSSATLPVPASVTNPPKKPGVSTTAILLLVGAAGAAWYFSQRSA